MIISSNIPDYLIEIPDYRMRQLADAIWTGARGHMPCPAYGRERERERERENRLRAFCPPQSAACPLTGRKGTQHPRMLTARGGIWRLPNTGRSTTLSDLTRRRGGGFMFIQTPDHLVACGVIISRLPEYLIQNPMIISKTPGYLIQNP